MGGLTAIWAIYPSKAIGCRPNSMFPIPSANLLANSRRDPTASSKPDLMPKLDLGPLSGCNSIDPVIVRPVRC
ncbi:hypothetical protein GW17_00062287 [Ensete ventricosum]|nr:hypothetical protein GW17_00062287 [Ensete ventricosum]